MELQDYIEKYKSLGFVELVVPHDGESISTTYDSKSGHVATNGEGHSISSGHWFPLFIKSLINELDKLLISSVPICNCNLLKLRITDRHECGHQ